MAAAGRPRGGHGEAPASNAGANGECRADRLKASKAAVPAVSTASDSVRAKRPASLSPSIHRHPRAGSPTGWAWSLAARPGTRPSRARRRLLGRGCGREDQPLADQGTGDERHTRSFREGSEQLIGSANATFGVVAERHPDRDRAAFALDDPVSGDERRIGACRCDALPRDDRILDVDRHDERTQVVGDRGLALPALARQRWLSEQSGGGEANRGGIDDGLKDRAIHRRRDASWQGCLAQPHVVHVDEDVVRGKRRQQRIAHAPAWEPFGQPDVEELGLARDRRPERRGGGEPRPPPGSVEAGHRQARRRERRLPGRLLGAPGEVWVQRRSGEDEPPSLNRLAGRRPGDRGRGVRMVDHAC